MHKAFFVLKFFELFIDAWCISVQLRGFLSFTMAWDHLVFLLIYIFFDIITMLSVLDLCRAIMWPLWFEFMLNFCSATIFFTVAIILMYKAELDYVEIYVDEVDKSSIHPYFDVAKTQSVMTLLSGFFNLMHALLLIDLIINLPSSSGTTPDDFYVDDENDVQKPLQLYFFGRRVHNYCYKRCQWFRDFGVKTNI